VEQEITAGKKDLGRDLRWIGVEKVPDKGDCARSGDDPKNGTEGEVTRGVMR